MASVVQLTEEGHCRCTANPRAFPHFLAGSFSGLSLLLNVEQYEYMKGPQNDAGVKVSTEVGEISTTG